MKAINIGKRFEIYDDSLQSFDRLPAQTYIVRFNKMSGFYLEEYSEIEISEDKIYGVHQEKVEKVLKSFEKINRSLGVILSGDKGIGKSLFAKLLSSKAIERGLPLIVVDKFIPGIASYIEQIEQEVVVLFDEFDKTFGEIETSENEANPQASLLSLFDGISQGKKLFVVTCNELRKLNSYLVNRPGRFHYHFRFEYPTPQEIKEYLADKLEEQYYGEIDKVIAFSRKVNINYDCLRAITFELNNSGEAFEKVIQDLNIINMNALSYELTLYFEDGTVMNNKHCFLDLFSQELDCVCLYDLEGRASVAVKFTPANCVFDDRSRANVIMAENLRLEYNDDEDKEQVEKVKALVPKALFITKCLEKNIHYAI